MSSGIPGESQRQAPEGPPSEAADSRRPAQEDAAPQADPGAPDERPVTPLPRPERLSRRRSGRLVAGVAAGVAEHLGVPVLWVRATFAGLAACGGAGIVAYALLWMFAPQRPGDGHSASEREIRQGIGLILLGVGLTVAVASFSWLPSWLVVPLAAILLGCAVVWREADESQRGRWRQSARSGAGEVVFGGGGRAAMLRVLAGAVLVLLGLAVFLSGDASLGTLRFALLAVLVTVAGLALLTVPWWVRLARDLNVERAGRIRSQERAEIAAHLHDSVLQTLALIQKQADSGREVRRLARSQERELRQWLYAPDGYGRASEHPAGLPSPPRPGSAAASDARPVQAAPSTVSGELARICGEVEDIFAVTVQPVVVGDCESDEPIVATLAAAREGIVNAAKHAGVQEVSVYAEVQTNRFEVFVRDRGSGFDPELVPADRHGLADSVRGRMERSGGGVRLRTALGEGTEVHLDLPR